MTRPSSHPVRLTLANLHDEVRHGRSVAMVTAYDHPSARMAERAGVDMILVGDSVGMVVLGRASTNDVSMDEMVLFTRAVTLGAPRTIVVADLPFMSYQPSDEIAVMNAGRLVAQGGADAVKLEGGGAMVGRIRAIVDAGIAVVGHLGLTPQSAPALGGFRAQARTADAARQLLDDARAIEAAGATALVLEAIPAEVASLVTQHVSIPTIGIGAGAATSGQVLVWHDLLGVTPDVARFVERFGDAATPTVDAVRAYVDAVRGGEFPRTEHTYAMPQAELGELLAMQR